ncbi:MAG: fused MFS/spermidine synthase [Acidobacteria bacterium]|nr:fused MFS/spermidine synthase [Acidobacteriota bacterium]
MAKFGVTTPMVSVVLSVFMAGLALGSWGGGVLVRRLQSSGAAAPLRLYGLVEFLIGVSGLLVPHLINFGYELLSNGEKVLAWDSSLYYLASGSWVALSLLPWCTCMGATIPLGMAAIRKTDPGSSPRSFSYLYLSNVLGAILGTLIPAFFLMEMFGFQGTLRIAASLNGILAVTVFAVSFGHLSSVETAAPVARKIEPRKLYSLPIGSTFWLLFLTGTCSMAMEVVWIRQFAIYLGNVVYSFAIILALYLLATYTGSQLYRWWVRSHDPQASGKAWIFLGLLALLPLPFADPTLLLPGDSLLWRVLRIAMGVVPFSAMLGFLTPLLVDHFSQGDPDRAGRAYAVNVLGSIAGPLLSGFWILPWLGDHWGLAALSLPLFGIGLLTAFWPAPDQAIRRTAFQNRILYAGVVLLSIPLVAVTRGNEAKYPRRAELRDYTATVIAAGDGMRKILVVNGFGMTVLTPITKYMAHLPLAFLDRPPQNGLVICFGMGTTFRSMLSWGIDSTAVELVPSVPQLFGYYHADGPELLKSPLAHIVVDDGRRFLERSTEQYDVITLDPPPPVSAPTSSLLFSREFYAIVKRHLRPGGIVQVWLYVQDSRWDPAFQAAAVKAIQDSFPYTRAFESLGSWGFHILASNEPIPARDARALVSHLPPLAVADLAEWGPFPSAEEMFARVVQRERSLDSLAAASPRVPPIQDDQPINEYFFLRRIFNWYR